MKAGMIYQIPEDQTAAKLWWRVSVGAGYQFREQALSPGDYVRFISEGWGPGSDPGRETRFEDMQTGAIGALSPAGVWGTFPKWLTPAGATEEDIKPHD